MKKDVRKEQVTLLRFERQIAGLAAALAAGSATTASAAGKLGGTAATDAYADIQASLLQLADTTTKAHEVLNAQAVELGFKTLQVNGVPKDPPAEVVRSILGLG